MKKYIFLVTAFIGTGFFCACHRDGIDNNMNDAYEQPAKCKSPVTPDKPYEVKHYGNRNDEASRQDSSANRVKDTIHK